MLSYASTFNIDRWHHCILSVLSLQRPRNVRPGSSVPAEADQKPAGGKAGGEEEGEEATPPVVPAEGDDGDETSGPPPAKMTMEQVDEFFSNTMERLNTDDERESIKSKVCL